MKTFLAFITFLDSFKLRDFQTRPEIAQAPGLMSVKLTRLNALARYTSHSNPSRVSGSVHEEYLLTLLGLPSKGTFLLSHIAAYLPAIQTSKMSPRSREFS